MLNVSGRYKITGTQLDTQQDLVVRGLEVAPVDSRDEVEDRIGLPFGMLVSSSRTPAGRFACPCPSRAT
jgi:hypothetical protein